ncbi:hypothetical protein FB451DRAFT_1496231 [Mycena latifolia]|nr:hypothetical protein FB451DRAFT_1496231 [Mycena latifolia]
MSPGLLRAKPASWCTLRALDVQNELDACKLDGLKVLWALLALYLVVAAFVLLVGFFGVLKVRLASLSFPSFPSFALSHFRLLPHLAFTAFLTVLAAYAAWAPGRLACEEVAQFLAFLSPDETCERATVALLAGMRVLTGIHLHLLLGASTHYAHLVATATANGGYRSGECDGTPPAERAHGRRDVYTRARARGQRARAQRRGVGPCARARGARGAQQARVDLRGPRPPNSPRLVLVAILVPARLSPSPSASVFLRPGDTRTPCPCTYPRPPWSSLHHTYLRPPPTSIFLRSHFLPPALTCLSLPTLVLFP